MKPYVICHMLSSIDGRIATRLWSESPDGVRTDWTAAYNRAHDAQDSDGWIVGRVTMAEIVTAEPHPPADYPQVARPLHIAKGGAGSFAIALDPSGKLHFEAGIVDGDQLIVLLGSEVPDRHLAELASDGVSYIVSETPGIDLAAMLDMLGSAFGIHRLMLEGGGGINGSFMAGGLVDEISLLVAPAVDGREGGRAIFEAGVEGLAGRVRLRFLSATPADHGIVHLRYAVETNVRRV